MCRRDCPREAARDFPFPLQVDGQQRDDHVGRDETVALVDDAEAVGVAVRGQADVELLVRDDLPQFDEVFLVAFRREAAEIRVSIVVNDLDLDARLEQEVVQIVARRAVKGVDRDPDPLRRIDLRAWARVVLGQGQAGPGDEGEQPALAEGAGSRSPSGAARRAIVRTSGSTRG